MDQGITVTQCYDYLIKLIDRDDIHNLSGGSDAELNDINVWQKPKSGLLTISRKQK